MAEKLKVKSKPTKYIGISFCKECNNMLYPKEDTINKQLLYACRNCGFDKVAKNNCVYVNNLADTFDELRCINTDIIQDPALPRTKYCPTLPQYCPRCMNNDVVFFQSDNRKTIENQMKLYYVCANVDCCHRWTQ